jgi:hypothetical protein
MLQLTCPPKNQSGYDVILKGQKVGTNGQEKLIIKNRWLEIK